MYSGIATQSKEFVMGTIHKYDWVQLGGAVKHPEQGKIIDMSQAVQNEYGVKDAYLKIYPISGYGNPQILREVLKIEKPDAILHFYRPKILDLVISIWNMKLDKTFLLCIIIFGMIYQTHYIIQIIIEVQIC